MQPWSREFTGRLDELEIESEALRGNALGDPNVRPLWVYTPPGYDDEPERRYPCVYVIQGLTGQLDMWRNREPFRPNYPEMVDELFASGRGAADARRVRRCVDVARREPVPQLAGHGSLSGLPV